MFAGILCESRLTPNLNLKCIHPSESRLNVFFLRQHPLILTTHGLPHCAHDTGISDHLCDYSILNSTESSYWISSHGATPCTNFLPYDTILRHLSHPTSSFLPMPYISLDMDCTVCIQLSHVCECSKIPTVLAFEMNNNHGYVNTFIHTKCHPLKLSN